MLVDEATIQVTAGKGGDGHVSFRREKYVPNGGPDGGDGGRGGDVLVTVDEHAHGLEEFRRKKQFRADDGEPGGRQQKSGKDGEQLELKVPPGTILRERRDDGSLRTVADMAQLGQSVRIAHGGNGGWGNQHFATSIKQAPDWSKPGKPGEERTLELEWQLIADVALIGLPNAGKSTFLSVISHATPKIADYPFTTLEPELGVTTVHDRSFVVADIPGLIAGASEGRGLGDAFLRHIRRTSVLLHLVSVEEEDVVLAYQTIRAELEAFDVTLSQRPEVVALAKVELRDKDEVQEKQTMLEKVSGGSVFQLSSVTHVGVQVLLEALLGCLPTIPRVAEGSVVGEGEED